MVTIRGRLRRLVRGPSPPHTASPEPPRNAQNGAGNADADTTFTTSKAFEILRNGRRRAVLMTLFKRGEPMELGELIRVVAAKEYDIDPDAVSAEQYKRVYTGLYQHHLPAMADLDIIRYHQSENTVCLGDRASLLKPYLEISSEQASRDNRVVVGGVALAGMGLLGVTTSGVAPDYVVAIATGGLLLAATAMRIRGRHRASLTAYTGRTSIH